MKSRPAEDRRGRLSAPLPPAAASRERARGDQKGGEDAETSELHKEGHTTTGRRLFCKDFPRFQYYALSSYALTCALLKTGTRGHAAPFGNFGARPESWARPVLLSPNTCCLVC